MAELSGSDRAENGVPAGDVNVPLGEPYRSNRVPGGSVVVWGGPSNPRFGGYIGVASPDASHHVFIFRMKLGILAAGIAVARTPTTTSASPCVKEGGVPIKLTDGVSNPNGSILLNGFPPT